MSSAVVSAPVGMATAQQQTTTQLQSPSKQGQVFSPPPESADFQGKHMGLAGQGNLPEVEVAASSSRPSSASAVDVSPNSGPRSAEGTPEYRELMDVVSRVAPDVVRQVMRDRWEKCLSGSEYHLNFVLKAIVPSATPAMLALALQASVDLAETRKRMLDTLTSKDMDGLADAILSKASDDFLDQAMARRLETIGARRLVNLLARAERLGYDVRDVVEEKTATNGTEKVVPTTAPPWPSTPATRAVNPQTLQAQLAMSLRQSKGQQQQQQGETVGSMHYATPAKSTSPYGVVHCTRCDRPCSGDQAFRYHAQKRACEHSHKVDRIGIDVCPHCGCFFGSAQGLTYHVKSKVCGDYSYGTEQAVLSDLMSRPRVPYKSAVTNRTLPYSSLPPLMAARIGATPMQMKTLTVQPMTPAAVSRTSTPGRMNGSVEDPYSKLTPEARRAFEQEMQMAEEKYGGMMREAMNLPEQQREDYLNRLKNSFNSKQSTTRKKYGIRLRERRSKAEIEEERNRLLSSAPPPAKRSRPNSTMTNSTPVDSGNNTPAGPTVQSGGLLEVAGQAEHVDPTTLLTPPVPSLAQKMMTQAGTSADPMQIEDESSTDGDEEEGEGEEGEEEGEEDEEEEDDDDIPARMPIQFPVS
ncbi:hypothetical protein GQ602_007213 [Ophiocordyceps camponoti-floridani]|uniref:Uncharacterized protein n=1 Tax=Ophiocordyceps camponoti-floridani TaxID=2030778 RepID=A0A8H4Q0Z4_9HYPO|nr:hypothetical protein GQ602_007213 [Ophiocordyceps camponoti-floridani]